MIESEDICIWADGTWCYGCELEEMGHLSDDFAVIRTDTTEYDAFIAKENS